MKGMDQVKTKTKRFYLRGDSTTDEQIKWLFDKLIAEAEKEKEKKKQGLETRFQPDRRKGRPPV